MKTPATKTITFTFASHPNKDPNLRWKAHLTFPPNSDESSTLSVAVVDGNDQPIPNATFEFASQQIEIRDGRGSLSARDFLSGRHATALWLHLPNHAPIPGGLTFA